MAELRSGLSSLWLVTVQRRCLGRMCDDAPFVSRISSKKVFREFGVQLLSQRLLVQQLLLLSLLLLRMRGLPLLVAMCGVMLSMMIP